MDFLIILIIMSILIVIYINITNSNHKENYSQATLLQLVTKGPQDTYLTGDAHKYIPPYYYYYGWGPFYWPTRVGRTNYYYYRPYGLLV